MNSPEQREVVAREDLIELVASLRFEAGQGDHGLSCLMLEAADALSAIAKAEIHSLVEEDEGASQSQPCAETGTHIPSSPPGPALLESRDRQWLLQHLLHQRWPSHCGEGIADRREREFHNERLDRISDAIANSGTCS